MTRNPDSTPRETGLAIFERERFFACLGEDRGLAREILRAILKNLPDQIDQLRARIESQDAAGAVLVAHKIQGGIGTVAGDALVALARDLERPGRRCAAPARIATGPRPGRPRAFRP